ncbi:MAG: DUF1850 domain-containing protein [Acidilobaceae archaeon]|nr:DUF1850 domain-containing protein [Acidilobaceae archaeon]
MPLLEVVAGSSSYYFFLPAQIEISYIHSVEGYAVREVIEASPLCLRLREAPVAYGAGSSSSLADAKRLRAQPCLGRELVVDLRHAVKPRLEVKGREIPSAEARLRVVWIPLWEILFRVYKGEVVG